MKLHSSIDQRLLLVSHQAVPTHFTTKFPPCDWLENARQIFLCAVIANQVAVMTTAYWSCGVVRESSRTVVPNRGGIPSQGGISWFQGRIFHL